MSTNNICLTKIIFELIIKYAPYLFFCLIKEGMGTYCWVNLHDNGYKMFAFHFWINIKYTGFEMIKAIKYLHSSFWITIKCTLLNQTG